MIDLMSWNPWHGCRKYSEGCAECTMAFACAGCGNCGRCKDVELVDLNNIWVPE